MIRDVTYGRVLELHNAGRTITAIARALKIGRATVRRWLAADGPPSQRAPRGLTAARRKQIAQRRRKILQLCSAEHEETRRRVTPKRRLVREKTMTVRTFPSAARVAREYNRTNNGPPISVRTVLRDLRHGGMKPYRQPLGPSLSKAQCEARVAFAKKVLRTSKAKRQTIMFSDEKYFDTKQRRFYSYWARSPEGIPSAGYVQGGPKLMFLGFMSRTHRRLVACTAESMKHEYYAELLGKYAPVLRRHWFQQDNASPHSKLLRDGWFTANNIEVLGWPAHSPDLNVIETVWARLERDVSQEGPSSVEEIKEFVMKAWKNVTQTDLRRLCDEFDDRLRVCIAEEGRIVTRGKLQRWRADAKRAAAKEKAKAAGKRKN